MVKDVKDPNFGHDGEAVYEDCQHGLSPFAIPSLLVFGVQLKNEERAENFEKGFEYNGSRI